MNRLKLLSIFLVVALLVWTIEALYLTQRNTATLARIKTAEIQNRNRQVLDYKQKLKELGQEYDKKKHLATGESVFDRIFNTQDQSIVNLVMRVAREALPEAWTCNVEVEEFTHFILLVYLPPNAQRVTPDQVVSYLRPILKYCDWCLSDVAFFDKTRKSYLFFDKSMLDAIKKDKVISQVLIIRAQEQGESFTRFNSVTIECDKHGSQLFLSLEVAGPKGVVTCVALVDTGASITTLSDEIVSKTGFENLQSTPYRRFKTANGWTALPIVRRKVTVGVIRKGIEVAVDQRGELNLLGVNFFAGKGYMIDFQNSAIYVWEK